MAQEDNIRKINVSEDVAWFKNNPVVLSKDDIDEKPLRKARKHDALMGIISMDAEKDYKRIHLREKYGV